MLLSVSSGGSRRLMAEAAARLARAGHVVSVVDGHAASVEAASRSLEWKARTHLLERRRDLRAAPPRYRAFYLDESLSLLAATQFIRRSRPHLLVVGEDGIAGNAWLIRAARRAGVAVLDMPYGFGTVADFDNDLARKEAAGEMVRPDGPYGEEVASRFPAWIKTGRFAGAIMFPPELIVIREALGLGLVNPWTVHGGKADRLAVESAAMRAHYLREGVPEAKLADTGTIYCDLVSEALARNAAAAEAHRSGRKIAPEETSILVCWPPSYHADRGANCEFATYEELTLIVLRALARLPRTRVTVSLHPSAGDGLRATIADLGVGVSDEHVVSLIPLHDVYVSCFSSTIRWAVAAGKPVINYDFYGFNLPEFAGLPGVMEVARFSDFAAAVSRLAGDDAHFETIAGHQRRAAPQWGRLDGRNFDRIVDLMDRLIRTPRRERAMDRGPAA